MASPPRDGNDLDPLERWDLWVDTAIREAQRRDDFDDLPGRGQPLRLDDNPFAGDRALGFGVLKNAGVLPYWMELDKEMGADLATLRELRERTSRSLSERVASTSASVEPEPAANVAGARRRFAALVWWLFGGNGPGGRKAADWHRSAPAALDAERRRARRAYLEQAARLDETIRRSNAALPDDLRWRERPRLLPEQAVRDLDVAGAPIESDGRSSARCAGGPVSSERKPDG